MPKRNPLSTRCTSVRENGDFCDLQSLPDAPFPICLRHAAQVLRYLNSYAPNGLDDRILVAVRGYDLAQETKAERERLKPPPVGHVYYVQVGALIKIGHTENLLSRMRAYPPGSRLLATELGTLTTEAQRHRQFADELRHRREWFEPSPRLMAHIAALREQAA